MDDRADWVRSTVHDWEGRLVAYAARILAGDVERARDVVQDVFLRLWEADRDEVEGHVGAWLYTVCRRRAIDLHRKEARMTTSREPAVMTQAASGGSTPRASGHGPGPVEAAAERETQGTGGGLLGAVADLPPRQQEAVRLRFQGGLSYAAIARVMDTSVSNVGVLLHVAIGALRNRLDPAAVAPETGGAA